MEHLGSVPIPESLSVLSPEGGLLFVGSVLGDSVLVRLLAGEEADRGAAAGGAGGYIQELQRFINIGPILDMCVVPSNMDRGGGGRGGNSSSKVYSFSCIVQ